MGVIKPTGASQKDIVALLVALTSSVVNLRLNLIAAYQKMDADFADVTNASVDYESVLGAGGSDDDALIAAPATVNGNEVTV